MTTSRRLDRQEMERRVELLRELWEDANRRYQQYGSDPRICNFLRIAVEAAKEAAMVAVEQLEAYREEWERVK